MLTDALEIPNLERENAKKHHIQGWEEMPENLRLWESDLYADSDISMPRGFAIDLFDGLEALGYEAELIDERAKPSLFRLGHKIRARDHQLPAVEEILDYEQGIYKAPPGSGKTVTVLMAGRRASSKCIIIVNTKEILHQWIARIGEHLGDVGQIGQIGDGKFEIGYNWTVAIANSIHSRYEQLQGNGFFDEFGFVCLDECHHATAETYMRIMDSFSSRYRIGVSATPDKTGDFALAQLILGPIIHQTKHEVLEGTGHLMRPKIIRVKTEFGFNFKGTTSKFARTNYPQLVEALLSDPTRNASIVGALLQEEGHHCLCLTKRHAHIDLLEAMALEAGYEFPIYRLTGKEKSQHRKDVVAAIGAEPGLVISTVADEALDVPRIDRGFLVFPQSNIGLIEQQVGRFERTHPDKTESIVYDWADVKVGPLRAQWRKRFYGVYHKRGFEVVKTHVNDYIQDEYIA